MEAMKPMEAMRPLDRWDVDRWWPEALGEPSSAGSQAEVRYAFFADARRLVVERDGETAHYDTADHWVTGVSQSHGLNEDLAFITPDGTLDLKSLRTVVEEDD